MYGNLAILALFAALYSTIAGRVEKSTLSGPIIYVAFGFLAGPYGLGWLQSDVGSTGLRWAADLTLAVILFTDAASTDFSALRRFMAIPQRMLLLGLPMIIGMGFLVGVMVFDALGVFEVAALATMLAATDAALGRAVVTNDKVPKRLREALNLESGLNDGICVPFLLLFIALALGESEGSYTGLAFRLLAEEIGIGLAVGLGVTYAGGLLLRSSHAHGWLTDVWRQVTVVGLSIGSFALAQTLHGSGYIAAFTGGLLFGALSREKTHGLIRSAEGIGETLALATWVLFGASLVGQTWAHFTWEVLVYAVLSLTVVRMLPIYLSLWGTGLHARSKLFLGWFGPRGLASIVFAVIVLGHDLPGGELLAHTVVCTVLLSVVLHGVTANVFSRKIGRWADRMRSVVAP
jgi:NhaP-type Na+/H+ or K+/H+ antiporter